MRKAILLICLALFTTAYFISCDKIHDPVMVTQPPVDTGTVDSTVKVRKILVEEFTGHKCGNCPAATRYIYQTLVPTYKEQLVVMAVHAGSYAYPETGNCYTDDFRTPDGNTYDLAANFGMSGAGEPDAMINRKGYPGNHVLYKPQWNDSISKIVTVAPDAWITIENTFDNSSRMAVVKVKTEFLNSLVGDYKLCVAITEDSIVACQIDYSLPAGHQDDSTYTHRHMFRGTLNTAFGNFLASDPVQNSTLEKTYSYSVPAAFNASHCNIVAYVFKDSNYEVIQADEEKLIK
jgi:hypothetical protein